LPSSSLLRCLLLDSYVPSARYSVTGTPHEQKKQLTSEPRPGSFVLRSRVVCHQAWRVHSYHLSVPGLERGTWVERIRPSLFLAGVGSPLFFFPSGGVADSLAQLPSLLYLGWFPTSGIRCQRSCSQPLFRDRFPTLSRSPLKPDHNYFRSDCSAQILVVT